MMFIFQSQTNENKNKLTKFHHGKYFKLIKKSCFYSACVLVIKDVISTKCYRYVQVRVIID